MPNFKHVFMAILASLSIVLVYGQEKTPQVLHLKVTSDIDPRSNRYVSLGLEKATEMNVDYIILELDTYGGALTDADEIRTAILNYERPVYAFINKDAASAGALISIACDSIYMSTGSSIGAATVVTGEGEAAPDKYQSYMRSIMRSTAEAKGRNPEIAEAMVDEEIRLDSLIKDGKVLTFSVSEAIEYGFCEAEVEGITDIMLRSGVTQYDTDLFELNWSERFIALFLNPAVSGVLILLILGGLYFELQSPGLGFPIIASMVAALLYFTPYYLNGLAENWEIIVFFVGLLLISLEVFIIPGFGIPGILGLIFTIGSLTLVMVNNDGLNFDLIEASLLNNALITSLIGFIGALFLMILLGARLTKTSFFNRFALTDVQDTSTGYTSSFYNKSLIGSVGTVVSVMRPSGRIMIDDAMYDAYTRGEYLEKGEKIKVIAAEGTSLKVQKSVP